MDDLLVPGLDVRRDEVRRRRDAGVETKAPVEILRAVCRVERVVRAGIERAIGRSERDRRAVVGGTRLVVGLVAFGRSGIDPRAEELALDVVENALALELAAGRIRRPRRHALAFDGAHRRGRIRLREVVVREREATDTAGLVALDALRVHHRLDVLPIRHVRRKAGRLGRRGRLVAVLRSEIGDDGVGATDADDRNESKKEVVGPHTPPKEHAACLPRSSPFQRVGIQYPPLFRGEMPPGRVAHGTARLSSLSGHDP